MSEEALLLAGTGPSPKAERLTRLLAFLGVAVRPGTYAEVIASTSSACPRRLIGSVEAFQSVLHMLADHPRGVELWRERAHSAFIYADARDSAGALEDVLRGLAPSGELRAARVDGSDVWKVADGLEELTGPMGGVCLRRGSADPSWAITSSGDLPGFVRIVAAGGQSAFVRILYHGVPVLLSTSDVIDIDSEVPVRGFDVRTQWAVSVPAVMYVKWAFPASCWKPKVRSACLVIDDPLLKPRYGFVDFASLSEAMKRHRFSTSIAFIPWNWRRSRKRVVQLFTENPDQLSLSVHGCDHTAAEFGSSDMGRILHKLGTAATRMEGHAARTGIHHDRVMVFPQGVFSTTAMAALKRSNYIGAVNTEITSVDATNRPLRVADVWDVAVMNYDQFPIYTRRYPWQGLENFAFDVLLGKPCLIVIHHDFCRNLNSHLLPFIDRLNGQIPRLAWSSLGEVLRRGYRWRETSPGAQEVQMYAAELLLENPSDNPLRCNVRRRDGDPAGVRQIMAGDVAVPWSHDGGFVQFQVELKARESCLVVVMFHSSPVPPGRSAGLKYRVKTAVRRYLSEFRDDYVARLKPDRTPPCH